MEQELDDCNIFVKYLPADLNDQGLRDLFSMYGSIVSAKVMIDQKKGTSLGYGFVRFEFAENAQKAAQEMSGKKIGKKKLLCKLSNLPNLTPTNLRPDTNLYVKPLLENTTEEELKRIFSPFGEILECTILYDKESGKSRQIGFVRFKELEDATNAMNKMNGFKFNEEGQPLVVRYAETENEKLVRKMKNSSVPSSPPSATYFVPQHYIYDIGNKQILVPVQMQEGIAYTIPPIGYGTVGGSNIYIPPFLPPAGLPHAISSLSSLSSLSPHNHLSPRSPHSPHSPHSTHSPHSPHSSHSAHSSYSHVKPVIPPLANLPQISPFSPRFTSPNTSMPNSGNGGEPNLFIFHLPPDIDDLRLKALFETYGVLESAKVMVDPQSGVSKGYGFVRYKYTEDADRAISAMNGYPIGNKFLKVSFKTTSPRSPKSVSISY